MPRGVEKMYFWLSRIYSLNFVSVNASFETSEAYREGCMLIK